MADETPDAPAAETKPTPRRRGPNKPKVEGAEKPPRKTRAPRAIAQTATAAIGKAEETVVEAAKKPAGVVANAAKSAAKAVKPRAAKRSTPRPASKGKSAAKPKRGWGSAILSGGLAAAGLAATATVFALRSSSKKPSPPKAPDPKPETKSAHQPDGTDSSRSFGAGIADESTIPDNA